MKQDIKDRWTSALRSGNFKQAKDALKTDNGYCCLGVLCEIAVEDGVIEPSVLVDGDYIYGDESYTVLPKQVTEWAGLDSYNPTVRYDEMTVPISDPNDSGVPFDVIADLIEEQL